MSSDLQPIDVLDLNESTFKLIANDWFLLTAGPKDKFNTMTASWGGFGELWNKKVCFVFVRPQRYTYGFMESNDSFSLSFFDESYRATLKLAGTKSGRDIDKMNGLGLTPIVGQSGAVHFGEARLVLDCRKVHFQDLDPSNFLDQAINDCYPKNDYHRRYIGEVVRALKGTTA